MRRMLAMAQKEFTQIRRDPILSRMIVGMPIVMVLLFGYAINFTLKNIELAVYDGSQDRISQSLIDSLKLEDKFKVSYTATSADDVSASIQENKARVGIAIPPGALATVRSDKAVDLKVFVDGSDPNFAFQAQAALRKSLGDLNSKLMTGKVLSGQSITPPITPSITTMFNPDNKTAWFMIPGISGLIMTIFTVLLTALSIVREGESRTMESLIATPIRPWEVVIGKILPYFFIATFVSIIVLSLGYFVFGVPMRGNIFYLFLLIILFVIGSLGVGVFVSSVARSQTQAVFGTFIYILPSIFLSGFVFPISGMPTFFKIISSAIPLRYLIDGVRAVMLKGGKFSEISTDLLALLIFSTVVLSLASLRFKKQIEA